MSTSFARFCLQTLSTLSLLSLEKIQLDHVPFGNKGRRHRSAPNPRENPNAAHPPPSLPTLHFPVLNINLLREKHQNADIIIQISVFRPDNVYSMNNKASELCPSVLLF